MKSQIVDFHEKPHGAPFQIVDHTLKARKSYLKRVDKAFASAEEFQAEKLKIATQTYEFVIT